MVSFSAVMCVFGYEGVLEDVIHLDLCVLGASIEMDQFRINFKVMVTNEHGPSPFHWW